ncbi:MAG TPA: DUF5694 domain-containing protein, partial [Gemmatimonadota bacterium]|nr:DUF5694 domain-containing protein [Gemmatimonadota bacterium]
SAVSTPLPLLLAFILGTSIAGFAQEPVILRPILPASCGSDDERIEVLLLGSYHMANPGADVFNVEADDVLAPGRQREIEEVVERLAAFQPTRVAIESVWGDTTAPARYRAYRAGGHELSRGEEEQIGFRLAARMDLPDVDPIDADGDFPFGPVQALAESDSTLARLLADGFETGQAAVETMARWLAEGTIGETLYRMNTPEAIQGAHDPYLRFLLPIVDDASAPGADLLSAWYDRNIRIFANLHRMGLGPDDRVFLLFGAGHIPILRQLVVDSPYFCVEDPLIYLPAPR